MNRSVNKSFSRFLIVWTGQLVSSIGSGLTAFALGIYAFQQTNTATAYSLVILFAFLPSFLLKPIGGVLTDRLDRKLMMIIGDLGSASGLVFIFCMLFAGVAGLGPVYLGVAVSSVFVALQNPAYKASVTDLLDEEAYSKAGGLMQLAESSKFLISPILAGVLLSIMDIKYVLLIDIFTFLIAVVAVFSIKEKPESTGAGQEQGRFWVDLVEGFSYTVSNKGVIWLLTIISLITFSVGFLQTLLGPMVLSFSDSKTLGVIMSVSATGMLISSFLIGVFGKTNRQVNVLSVSLALTGIFYTFLGVSTNIVIIMACGFLFFFMLPFVNTSLDVLVRQNVENNMQGRVWSIVGLISQFGMLIAFSIAGKLADLVFNPLFLRGGFVASSIGKIIGTGQGRGIGFMFVLSGIMVFIIAVVAGKMKIVRALELEKSSKNSGLIIINS